MRRSILLALVAAVTAGCTVLGPNYARPTVDAPANFRFADAEARALADTRWWQELRDPVLDELISSALAGNLDVRIAAANVEAFQGALGTTRAALLPQVGVQATGARQRSSERAGPAPQPNPFDSVQVGISAAWEIDLFGKLARRTDAARAELLAAEEARRAVILSLVSAVASSYVDLRRLDKQLEIARSTAAGRAESLKLFVDRFQGGVISEIDLNQARSEYATAVAAVPVLEQEIAQRENALALLLGRNPQAIARGQTLDVLALPAVPAGLPSELLERRPDLRQAEQQLVAANARIGAARALYFPSISLTGLAGQASSSLNGLWSGPARLWSFAADVSAPIFSGGAIAGQVQSAEAQQRAALYSYQKAIQSAFRDVEDALIGRQKGREQLAALTRQLEALRSYSELSRLRYESGYANYLEVLDAERSLFNAELGYAQAQSAPLAQHIALYKSMGGGWVIEAEQLAPAPLAKR